MVVVGGITPAPSLRVREASMAKLTITHVDDVEIQTYPGPTLASGVRWAKVLSPDDYELQLIVADLEPGASLQWPPLHGDEGVYVESGELQINGSTCPEGGALILESGSSETVTATRDTRIVHCRPKSTEPPTDGLYGAPDVDHHSVHVVGDNGWFQSGQQEGVLATWFADSTCRRCRIAFFRVDHPSGFAGNFHSHSQDEIIYVLTGSVQLGPREYGPGTALNIPGDVPYRVSYPNGAEFLNYRRDVSEQRYGKDGPVRLEGALARGGRLVEDFR
jgi:hypothetical protein